MAPQPLLPPATPPPRWTRLPLPGYRHVPGLTPHPVTDAAGHSHGSTPPVVPPRHAQLPGKWRRCPLYLYGVDLWNRAYLWEAHEAWEAVWIAVGRASPPGQALQGLIQLAAALLQHHHGLERGARGNRAKALARLQPLVAQLAPGERLLGIDLPAFLRQVDDWLDGRGPYPLLLLAPRSEASPSKVDNCADRLVSLPGAAADDQPGGSAR